MLEFLTSVAPIEAANVANYAIRLLEWRSSLSDDFESLIEINDLSVAEQHLAKRIQDEIQEAEGMHFRDLSDSASDKYVVELARIVTSLTVDTLSDYEMKRGELILAQWEQRDQVERDETLKLSRIQDAGEKPYQDSRPSSQRIGVRRRRRYRRFWARICVEFYGSMLSYARKLTNDPLRAVDIVQSVIVRLLYLSPDPRSSRNHKAYLLRVVRNEWLDSERAAFHRNIESLEESEFLESHEPDVFSILEKTEFPERLEREIRSSTPELIRTIRLSLSGYTVKEIASRLNEPESRIRYRLARFRLQIHRMKDKKGTQS